MKKLRNAILPILIASAFLIVWGVSSMGCDEDVCSEFDLEQCEDIYYDCLDDRNITVTDAGAETDEYCSIEYCQCLDNEGCDWSAVPVCEE